MGFGRKLVYRAAKMPGLRRKFCPICGKYSAFFLPFGYGEKVFKQLNIVGGGVRRECTCPYCFSRDRFRWTYEVIKRYTRVLDGKCRVLHIAPEPQIAVRIRENNGRCDYLTGDIEPGRADSVVNVTDMPFGDTEFDYIIINHVLEHIADEAAAMQELKRCLKPDGALLISFPICTDLPTFENPAVTSPSERLQVYGQEDHVRLYGYDCEKYLERYGFTVEKYTVKDCLPPNEIKRQSLIAEDTAFVCRVKSAG